MLAFGHSSSGVIVAAGGVYLYSQNQSSIVAWLILAILTGILSHYIGDFIPHGHYNFNVKKLCFRSTLLFGLDFFGVTILFGLLLINKLGIGLELLFLIAAIMGAQLPDMWEGLIDLGLIPKSKFAKFHRHWHYTILHWHNEPASNLPGHGRPIRFADIWQLVVLTWAIWLILNFPKI